MGGEYYYGFGFHLSCDLSADFLKFLVGGVLGILHYVGSAVGKEVDWCAGRHGRVGESA